MLGKSLRKFKPNIILRNATSISKQQYQKIVPDSPGLETAIGTAINIALSPLHLIGNGLFTIKPNHVGVATYFSKYRGATYSSGLNWTPTPFGFNCKSVFMGARTISMKESKIIDGNGNPILVSGIMNYTVLDPAQYLFGVNEPEHYISNQSEKILKKVVSGYSYDELQNNSEKVQEKLMNEVQNVLDVAGIKVTDFSLTDMNYSKEIAQSMLVRQQATAYIEARGLVAKAACDIVKDVIETFGDKLDARGQADLVKNLLVVITSNSNVQPVINVSE